MDLGGWRSQGWADLVLCGLGGGVASTPQGLSPLLGPCHPRRRPIGPILSGGGGDGPSLRMSSPAPISQSDQKHRLCFLSGGPGSSFRPWRVAQTHPVCGPLEPTCPPRVCAWAGGDPRHSACSSELSPIYTGPLLCPLCCHSWTLSKTKVSKHLRAGRGCRRVCLNAPNLGGVMTPPLAGQACTHGQSETGHLYASAWCTE